MVVTKKTVNFSTDHCKVKDPSSLLGSRAFLDIAPFYSWDWGCFYAIPQEKKFWLPLKLTNKTGNCIKKVKHRLNRNFDCEGWLTFSDGTPFYLIQKALRNINMIKWNIDTTSRTTSKLCVYIKKYFKRKHKTHKIQKETWLEIGTAPCKNKDYYMICKAPCQRGKQKIMNSKGQQTHLLIPLA